MYFNLFKWQKKEHKKNTHTHCLLELLYGIECTTLYTNIGIWHVRRKIAA